MSFWIRNGLWMYAAILRTCVRSVTWPKMGRGNLSTVTQMTMNPDLSGFLNMWGDTTLLNTSEHSHTTKRTCSMFSLIGSDVNWDVRYFEHRCNVTLAKKEPWKKSHFATGDICCQVSKGLINMLTKTVDLVSGMNESAKSPFPIWQQSKSNGFAFALKKEQNPHTDIITQRWNATSIPLGFINIFISLIWLLLISPSALSLKPWGTVNTSLYFIF